MHHLQDDGAQEWGVCPDYDVAVFLCQFVRDLERQLHRCGVVQCKRLNLCYQSSLCSDSSTGCCHNVHGTLVSFHIRFTAFSYLEVVCNFVKFCKS